MPLSPGQLLQNRYQIIRLIGQGGFGAVYGAWDRAVDQICAVKENLDMSAEAQRQFEREATILAGLRHPHLPLVTNHFSVPAQGQYLVMDFVEGDDLESLVEQQGQLPEQQVLSWMVQVCDALIYLHSQSPPIIHRDIKPANIKIGPDGRVMLVDFGIAKVYQSLHSTTVGAKAVTPGYSPPEQYGHGRTDVRSDIYALGAMLYTLLTNQLLPEAIDRLLYNTPIVPPRQLNSKISPEIEEVILKAIELSPENRFENVAKFEAALAGRITYPLPLLKYTLLFSLILVVSLLGVGIPYLNPNPPHFVDTLKSLSASMLTSPQSSSLESSPEVPSIPPDLDEHSKTNLAITYNDAGIDCYDRGDYQQAVVNFNQAIQLKPDFSEAYQNRALAFEKTKNYKLALADYTQAIQLRPDYANAYFGRANLQHHYLKQYSDAITDYERFLELSDDPALRKLVEEQLQTLRME